MKLSDICLITEDAPRLIRFYEKVLQVQADGDEIHASFTVAGADIVIYSKKAAESQMRFDFSKYWGSGNVKISFNVADVDAEYERLKCPHARLAIEFITEPTTYSWGARSVHFRDPDGNIVCFRTWIPGQINQKEGETDGGLEKRSG